MKKILLSFFLLSFIFSPHVLASLDLQSQLDSIRNYVKLLDQKIVAARSARQINKLAELKDLKRTELERARVLAEKIDGKEPVAEIKKPLIETPKENLILKEGEETSLKEQDELKIKEVLQQKESSAATLREAGFHVGSGVGGASLMISGGYFLPIQENLDLMLSAGYGYGSKHRLLDLGLAGIFPMEDSYVGFNLELVNYSRGTAVLGLSGEMGQGTNTGYGIIAGKKIGKVNVQLGYNTALGLTFGVIYKFKNIIVVDIE